LETLDNYVRRARNWATDVQTWGQVTFISRGDGEADYRYSVVKHIGVQFLRSVNSPPATPGNFIDEYVITIAHDPLWSDTSGSIGATYFAGKEIGHMEGGAVPEIYHNAYYDDGLIIPGVEPAKVSQFFLSTAGSGPFYEFWIGFRSSRYGAADALQPYWKLQTAPWTAADVTENYSDGDGYLNLVSRCDFSSQTAFGDRLVTRMSYQGVSEANTYSQRGRFLALLRAKCDGGDRTYIVRLAQGFYNSGVFDYYIPLQTVKVDKTNYFLYPMGFVEIPPGKYANTGRSGFFRNFALKLEAGVLSGSTGALCFDLILMCPTTEGFVHIQRADLDSAGYLELLQEPNGLVVGIQYDSRVTWTMVEPPIVQPQKWSVPVDGDICMFLVGQRETSHVLTDKAQVKITYLPQWRTFAR